MMPALLTRASRPPNARRATSTTPAATAASAKSATQISAVAFSARNNAAVSPSFSLAISTSKT